MDITLLIFLYIRHTRSFNANYKYGTVRQEMECLDKQFVDKEFEILATLLSRVYGLNPPDSFDNAVELFSVLLDVFQ